MGPRYGRARLMRWAAAGWADVHFGMRPEEARELLEGVRDGRLSVDDGVAVLGRPPVEDLGFARLDVHRELRQGMPEAIYAEKKTADQVVAIAARLLSATTGPVIVTRTPDDTASALVERFPEAVHVAAGRVVVIRSEADVDPKVCLGTLAVVSAGTSDLPVSEECAATAEAVGLKVERIHDVGVAGVHRALAVADQLRASDVVVVVAGMEGALASLVGGMVAAPVVAVPTSIGYGASFGGLAALLAMLNSCAAGVVVTNIDNGFGAAMFALRLMRAHNA